MDEGKLSTEFHGFIDRPGCRTMTLMKKKDVKRKVQEALEKYKPAKENTPAEQPRPGKATPKTSGAFTLRPEKKRG